MLGLFISAGILYGLIYLVTADKSRPSFGSWYSLHLA